jgi:hypothetical protein
VVTSAAHSNLLVLTHPSRSRSNACSYYTSVSVRSR